MHDVGTTPAERGGAPYLVMERLEGEDLRAVLDAGPLVPRKALDYAVSVRARSRLRVEHPRNAIGCDGPGHESAGGGRARRHSGDCATRQLECSCVALSPDGRWLAFTAVTGGNMQLWVRALDALSAQALSGTEGASFPFWSPDSRFIGFFAGGKLKKIAVAGGAAQTLCDTGLTYGGTWNRDGVIVYVAVAQSFDATRLAPAGEPAVIAARVGRLPNMSRGLYAVSDTGLLVYDPILNRQSKQLVWVDRSGKVIRSLGATFEAAAPRALFEFRSGNGLTVLAPYAASANGQRFLLDTIVWVDGEVDLTAIDKGREDRSGGGDAIRIAESAAEHTSVKGRFSGFCSCRPPRGGKTVKWDCAQDSKPCAERVIQRRSAYRVDNTAAAESMADPVGVRRRRPRRLGSAREQNSRLMRKTPSMEPAAPRVAYVLMIQQTRREA